MRTIRRDDRSIQKGVKVKNRDGDMEGTLTGGNHQCRMEGCRGTRLVTKWPDGKRTFPCTRGMDYDGEQNEWRILGY